MESQPQNLKFRNNPENFTHAVTVTYQVKVIISS